MNALKAVLIDPFTQVIRPLVVDLSNGLSEVYHALGCDLITLVYVGRHVVAVDDEGLFKPGQKFFSVIDRDGTTAPLAGRGLVFTTAPDGEIGDCDLSVGDLEVMVHFPTDQAVRAFRDGGGFDTVMGEAGDDLKLKPETATRIPVRPAIGDEGGS